MNLESFFAAPLFTCSREEWISRGNEGIASGCSSLERNLIWSSSMILWDQNCSDTNHSSKFLLFLSDRLHDDLVFSSSLLNGPTRSAPGRSRRSSPNDSSHSVRALDTNPTVKFFNTCFWTLGCRLN